MNRPELEIYALEPERYELQAAPQYRFLLDRRGFLQTLGGGILVLALVDSLSAQQRRGGGGGGGGNAPKDIGSWLHISPSGKVTAFTGKVEVGQNSRTSLTQAVAEELGAPMAAVELVMGDTFRVPYDMGTFGSLSTPQMAPQLRRAAAAARKLLPAGDWTGLPFSNLSGDMKAAAIGDAPVHPPLGNSEPKVNGRNFVTGSHQYVSDLTRPGMLYGKVIRPERYDATLSAIDASAAKAMPGVAFVEDNGFAAVAAPSSTLAARAAGAVKAQWKVDETSLSNTSSNASIYRDLKAGVTVPAKPELEAALAASTHKLERTYTVAYIAHVPLEPRAAVAEWSENGEMLTAWVGTQRPFGVRDELVEAFHLKPENVHVIMPDTGSGYGGKHTGEVAVEAARIAKAAGKPVKLVWSREEEFSWAYLRPAGVIEVRSGVDANGKLTAWDFHNYNSGTSAIQTLYDAPVKRTDFHAVKSPLRQGSYRGLAATANHFAREVHMDEIAQAAGIDPVEFRLRNTSDARLKAVIKAAAERFGWKGGKPKGGVGYGIAAGFEKGGYVACCAEVTAGNKVVRLVEAFECGAIVNPNHLQMQVEGAMVMGLGGALFESIEFGGGQLKNPRLSKYRVPRFRDLPAIDVVLVDRKDLPSAGAGETPIVGVAPAIANAIFAATGERLRSMPLLGSQGQNAAGGGAGLGTN